MAASWSWLLVQSSRYVDVVGTLCTNVDVIFSVSVNCLDRMILVVKFHEAMRQHISAL